MTTTDIVSIYFDFCDIVYENWKLGNQTYYTTYVKPYMKQVYNLLFLLLIMDIISHANADHFVIYDYCNNCGEEQEENKLVLGLCEGCYTNQQLRAQPYILFFIIYIMIQEHQFECDSCYMVFNRIDMIPTDGVNFCEECYDDL